MKQSLLSLLLLVSVSSYVSADENSKRASSDDRPRTYQRYAVTLAEYRLKELVTPDTTESGILKLIEEKEIEPIETIRLSAISDTESQVNFGKHVTVTTGTVTNFNRTARQTEHVDIGTRLRIRLAEHKMGTLVDISYSASRLEGDPAAETAPEIAQTTIDSTQILDAGKPRLLGATSAGQSSYVVVIVNRLP